MNLKNINLKTWLQYDINAKTNLRWCLLLLLSIFAFASSSKYFFKNKNEPLARHLTVSTNKSQASSRVLQPSVFAINNQSEIEMLDLDEESLDEDTADELSLKLDNQIFNDWLLVNSDRKFTHKLAGLDGRSSIPLFILFHSWKNYL